LKKADQGPQIIRQPGSTVPIPVGRETDIAQKANIYFSDVVDKKYEGDDLDLLGLTLLEATILTLAKDAPHDADARKEFLDRVMGKPKQRVDSTAVTVDLNTFLHQLAEMEDKDIPVAEVIEDGQQELRDIPETEDGPSLLC